MRNEIGEVLAVTHREQLETVGNVERFALSWTRGYWHEPLAREVHKNDHSKQGAVRYYRATETPAGPRVDHVGATDGGGVQVTFNATTVVLPKQRDAWSLMSVHSGYLANESRTLKVTASCAECRTVRGFSARLWLGVELTLGCHRCKHRVLDPSVDTTPVYTSAADVPPTHGLFKLDRVTMGKVKNCVAIIWATCTGPHCGGHKSSFNPSKWADTAVRLSCSKCCRTRISAAQRVTIKQRLAGGETVNKLWREYHVHKTTVQKLLTELRAEQRAADPERTETFRAVVYSEAWRAAEVA